MVWPAGLRTVVRENANVAVILIRSLAESRRLTGPVVQSDTEYSVIELAVTIPKWAPVDDAIQIGFVLVNRGPEGVYVNRRCACGPPSSGADIAIEVYDEHARLMRSKRPDIPPPTAADFVWLEPGRSTYGTMVHDLLWDHQLPVGRYMVDMVYRQVDAVPPELAGKPVFTGMIRPESKGFEVIHWGAPPPRREAPEPGGVAR